MGIAGIHAIPMMITCMLQGTFCDMGIPRTFYEENICSVLRTNDSISFMQGLHGRFLAGNTTTVAAT